MSETTETTETAETAATKPRLPGRPAAELPRDAARAVVYLPADLAERIKAHRARLQAERPQVPVSFASALRTLADERLSEIERGASSGSAA